MSRVAEEIHDAASDSQASTDTENDDEESEDAVDLIIGPVRHRYSKYEHPQADHMLELWQVFAQNVDPLTKVVHAPSLRSTFEHAAKDTRNISRSLNALMFAIYSVAVLSLSEQQCLDRFVTSRSHLLPRFVTATKVALTRANFTSSTSIVILQALALHILSIQNTHHPRSLWILTGVAVRMSEGIGLHKHVQEAALGSFEAEIRRRLWFYIKQQDNNVAEMCGQPKFRGSDAVIITGALAGTSDGETYSGVSKLPSGSLRPTDVIFCAVMSEFYAFAERMAALNRKHGGYDSLANDFSSKDSNMPRDEDIQDLEDSIEGKYLRYCDPSDALQLMTILFARLSLNVARFMAHHPRKWKTREQTPESERTYLWNVSLKLLGQLDMIQSSPHLQCFAWQSEQYLQWWPFIHVLDTLRADPTGPDTAEAWRLVEATFRNNPMIITNTKRSLYVAVGNLCLKAFSAYETANSDSSKLSLRTSSFIQDLRQKRELAKHRAQARVSSKQGKKTVTQDISSASFTNPAENVPSQSPSFTAGPAGLETTSNAQWFSDSPLTNFGMLDTNAGLMLAGDQNMDDIDWTQWDAWLSGNGAFWGNSDEAWITGG